MKPLEIRSCNHQHQMEWKKKIRYQSKYIVNILHYLTRNIFYFAENKNYYEQNGLITLVFTANCQALNGLNQPIGSTNGKGHIYIQNGKVTIDFPGVSFYRATDIAGWTSFSISSISIEK